MILCFSKNITDFRTKVRSHEILSDTVTDFCGVWSNDIIQYAKIGVASQAHANAEMRLEMRLKVVCNCFVVFRGRQFNQITVQRSQKKSTFQRIQTW